MPLSSSYVIILEFYLIVKLSSLVCYVVHIGKGHFKDKSILFDLRSSYYFVIIIIIIIIIILPYTKSALKTVLQFFNFLRKITPIVYSVDFLLCWFLSVVLLLDRIICQINKESDTNTLILIFWYDQCASCPIKLQDSLIIIISGKNQVISKFLYEACHSGKINLSPLPWLRVASFASPSIKFQDFLIIGIQRKSQITSCSSTYMVTVIKGR